MNDFETTVSILASLPLVIPAIWGLFSTGSASTSPLLFMRNRAAAIGVILILIALAFFLFSTATYEIGGCTGGIMSHTIECDTLPKELGRFLIGAQFFAMLYLFFIGLPAFICYVVAEIITRIRMKRA